MKNTPLISLMLAFAFMAPVLPQAYAVPTDRQEVAERLELNNATAEQIAATGTVDLETAKKIVQLREDLGGLQSYDDLQELNIPAAAMTKLQYATTIQGIAVDCNC